LTYPWYLSARAQSVLRGLLTRDPTKRLGSGPADAEEIKVHLLFSEIDWDKLARGKIPPPFVPIVKNSMDTSQFDSDFTSLPMFSPESYKVSLFEGCLSINLKSSAFCFSRKFGTISFFHRFVLRNQLASEARLRTTIFSKVSPSLINNFTTRIWIILKLRHILCGNSTGRLFCLFFYWSWPRNFLGEVKYANEHCLKWGAGILLVMLSA